MMKFDEFKPTKVVRIEEPKWTFGEMVAALFCIVIMGVLAVIVATLENGGVI